MYRITGTIRGLAPILFSAPTAATLRTLGGGGGGGGKPSQEEREAEPFEKVHRDGRGIVITRQMFKRCLLEGCRKAVIKEGRASAESYFKATVFVQSDLPLGKDEPDEILQVFGRRPPGPKGAGVIIRYPMFTEGWSAPFELLVVDDRRAVADIRKALDEAGLLVGLGSWRPEYGRFRVTEWSGKLPA